VAERTVPALPSRDLAETLAFWGRLGFVSLGDGEPDHAAHGH